MSKPSAPKAPDPVATAQAQTASNIASATSNAELNRIDQTSPLGSSTYQVTGKNPDGTPIYTQNTTLSPGEQNLFDLGVSGQTALANTEQGMIPGLQSAYSKEFDPGNYGANVQQAQTAAYNAQTQYLDPQFQQGQQSLNAGLANQGLSQGDTAYNNAQTQFANQKQQAYQGAQDSAVSAGNQEQNTLFQQGLAQYQEPLNIFSALSSGAQAQQPSFSQTPQANVANTNVAGITQDAYQNQLAAYQQQMSGINNLFSLGGSLGAAALLSDRRAKRDIVRVGRTSGGIPTYTFRYLDDDKEYLGVMADEVAPVIPDAVSIGDDGYFRVDYSRIK